MTVNGVLKSVVLAHILLMYIKKTLISRIFSWKYLAGIENRCTFASSKG